MKRFLGAILLLAVVLFSFSAVALSATGKTLPAKAAPVKVTVSGEIVDLSCYLGHGAKGAAHKECAAMCVANGGPMGLLTSKGILYVLTMNHENADAFSQAKKLAGGQAKITGPATVKNGTRALQVDGVEAS